MTVRLSEGKEWAVKQLLEQRMPLRKICRLVGVSRGTVSKIAAGRSCVPNKTQSELAQSRGFCPICGRDGFIPCVVCAANEAREAKLAQIRQRLGWKPWQG
jgi:formate dehydrogenase maturation protein FdhE